MFSIAPIIWLFALLALSVPVALVMAVAGIGGLHSIGGGGMVESILATSPLTSASSYDFVTLPMFLLMAEFVLLSGVADDLFTAAAAWTGRLRGGLGMATTLAGAGFGAVCGTSTAAAATLSATTLPGMIRQGYRPDIASGVVAISGTLSMLIPPSVALVIYGVIADVSIGKLLVAGVMPAMLIVAVICLTIYVLALRNPEAVPSGEGVPMRERLRLLRVAGPVLFLFAFVTGTIYTGIATPTEASALGALAGMLLALGKGKLSADGLRRALTRATYATCMILLIIVGATIFGYFFTLTQLTQSLVSWVGGINAPAWAIVCLIMLIYVLLGCFMDQTAILILTVPITVPLIMALGYDPVWFGVVVVVSAEVGMVTPPVGLNAFIVSRASGIPLQTVFRGLVPHIVAHALALLLLILVPEITLWLPGHM